jgi:CRP-like cAMP-binding protein
MREYSLGVPQDLGPVLEPEHLELLRRLGRGRIVPRGHHLYRQSEPADHVYLLDTGSAKSYIINSAGHEATLRIHLPGSLLGLTALASRPWRDAGALALEPAAVVAIKREALVAALNSAPELALRLVTLLVDRMRDFHYRVGEMPVHTVEQRILRALLAVCRTRVEDGQVLAASVELSHQEIASLVNTRRQTVTAVLGGLRAAGLVGREGRRLRILDLDRVHALLPKVVTGE